MDELQSHSFKDIWHEIYSFIHYAHYGTPRKLQIILRQNKGKFLSLLKNNPKDPEERKKVESGEIILHGVRRRLSAEFIKQVLALSDGLNLNEFDCVDLLWRAFQQQSKYLGLDPKDIAELLYFQERSYLINSITLLIKARNDATLHDKADLIVQFSNELLVDGLAGNIVKLLQDDKDLSKLPESQRMHRVKERKSLCELLFYIYYVTTLSGEELTRVTAVAREYSQLIKSAPADAHLYQVGYILTTTIISALDTSYELVDPRTGLKTGNHLADQPEFVRKFAELLNADWAFTGFQSVLLLAWSIFLLSSGHETDERVESTCNKAISMNFSVALRQVIEQPSFKTDAENYDLFIGVYDDLIVNFLTKMSPKVRDMKNDEEEQYRALETYAQYGIGTKPEPPKHHFENLMLLIAALYKNQPALALKYWTGQGAHQRLQQFIRFAGDIVMEYFFVPYIRMLTALASGPECALFTFEFVNNNGSKYISWNNFFTVLARYYEDFQEQQPEQSQNYRPGPKLPKAIKPEDVLALEAILDLMAAVLRESEEVRGKMQENSSWHAVEMFFGLLGCPVPPSLKAKLAHALAQFAKSPGLVNKIWSLLEASQVLQTAPQNKGVREGGIKFELSEIESPNEEYPFVSAFMELIRQLLHYVYVPGDLGLPHRVPGIWPFIDFIRDEVFLRFNNRGYKRASEKWKIAHQCLDIVYTLLEQYAPLPEDFETRVIEVQGRTYPAQKSVGHELMQSLLKQSALLKKIMYIISYGIKNFDEERVQSDDNQFEACLQLCLQIVQLVLEKQGEFLYLNQSAASPVVLTPLDQALMLDRSLIVHIAQFIHYPYNSAINLLSVRIVHLLSLRQEKHNKLVGVLHEAGQQKSMIAGYVEQLETEEEYQSEGAGADEMETESSELTPDTEERDETARSVRMAILELMASEVHRPWPNLVHFLLGYDIQLPIRAGYQPDPTDQHRTLRTCLHAIVDLFNDPEFTAHHPQLAERCMHLLYAMSRDSTLMPMMMRYLKSPSTDFLRRQLHALDREVSATQRVAQLHYRAWLLKTVALELHTTATSEQRTSNAALLALLFGNTVPEAGDERVDELDDYHMLPQARMKMRELLDVLDSVPSDPEPLQSPLLHKIRLDECTQLDERGFPHIDIELLHAALNDAHLAKPQHDDLAVAQPNAQSALRREIVALLKCAIAWNEVYAIYGAMYHMFEAWRQILEISLNECYEQLRGETVVYEMIQVLLALLTTERTRTELATAASQSLVALVAKLRVSFLNYTVNLAHDVSFNPENYLPVEQLHTILRGIVTALLRSESTPAMRGNLYTVLLNYLQFTHTPALSLHTHVQHQDKLWVAEEIESQHKRLMHGNMRILEELAGDKLIEVLAKDAADSSPLWRSVAFSTLDLLVHYDAQSKWLNYLTHRGYLRQFLEDIVRQDEALLSLLTTSSESLTLLYVFESKLSLLIRIAQTARGASYLLENGVVRVLSQASFIDQRPEESMVDINTSSWLPTVMDRYEQLLLPVLRLFVALLTSLPHHTDAAAQVLDLITQHSELFSAVLKDRAPVITLVSLNELALTTQLFYLLAHHDALLYDKLDTRWVKYQNQMLNLLSKYSIRERWSSKIRTPSSSLATPLTAQHDKHRHKLQLAREREQVESLVRTVTGNVVAFLRVITDPPRVGGTRSAKIVFTPSLELDYPALATSTRVTHRLPSLGTLVVFLKAALDQLATVSNELKESTRQLHSGAAPLLSLEARYTGLHEQDEARLDPQQRELVQQRRASQFVHEQKRAQRELYYVAENTLLLLWRHLDYFISAAPLYDVDTMELMDLNAQQEERKKTSATARLEQQLKLSRDQRAHLIKETVNVLDQDQHRTLDRFSKLFSPNEVNFVTVLIRRIRELLSAS